jgi:hypothetical protein
MLGKKNKKASKIKSRISQIEVASISCGIKFPPFRRVGLVYAPERHKDQEHNQNQQKNQPDRRRVTIIEPAHHFSLLLFKIGQKSFLFLQAVYS